ncbi:MAG: hypothetical protein AB8B55_04180 [Mariniblastus sp.]
MKISSNLLLPFVAAVFFIAVGAQQETASSTKKAVPEETTSASISEERLSQLEKRVEILERILFSTAKLETNRAERQLDRHKQRLGNTEKLFTRGLVNEIQLSQDRQRVDQAERELKLANAKSRQNTLVTELDVKQAEQDLEIAKQTLSYRRNMAQRGFISRAQVNEAALAVGEAEQSLEHAKIKLKAAEQLDAIKK